MPSIAVEPWAPEFGAPVDAALTASDAAVDVGVEVAAGAWEPRDPSPAATAAACAVFVDGIRRVDARVWLTGDVGRPVAGLCGSYAAGVVRCDTSGRVERAEVRRVLLAAAGAPTLRTRAGDYLPVAVAGDDQVLTAGLQRRMRDLEATVARDVDGADLVVVDGPLRGREAVPTAIGYVKTHHVEYLPAVVAGVVARLAPGQRTPLFVVASGSGGSWSRYSWYLRLPSAAGAGAHPWRGIVRCEAAADLSRDAACELADRAALTLPRFASTPHKDPRAPQNLYPIAGLERELRRRLGDPALCYRLLQTATVVA